MILKVNKDLSVSPVKSYKNAFIVSLAINVILLFTSMLNLTTEIISVVKDTVTIERTVEDMKLTDSGLTAELVKHGCVLPAVAVAQAKIESNIGKSNVGVQAKNMFGLTYHKCKLLVHQPHQFSLMYLTRIEICLNSDCHYICSQQMIHHQIKPH